MRIVFMGTPEIAQQALSELLSEGMDVAAVYTRQDKPVGRKQIVTPSPVKRRAAENRIPVYQPASFREAGAVDTLRALAPDLVVVVAYGMLLPKAVLEIPRHGCINMHVSMLPKYRGAAPIQWAVINGETKTGISIMQLDEGLDTGPVLAQRAVEIPPEATSGEMFERIGVIGARFLADVVRDIQNGRAVATPQAGEASRAPQLKKSDGEIDFSRPAAQLHNLVRGCNPWPLAWFGCGEKKVQVLRAKKADEAGRAGEIVRTDPLTVCCGEASIILETLRPEGGRSMSGAEWAVGKRFKAGDSLLEGEK